MIKTIVSQLRKTLDTDEVLGAAEYYDIQENHAFIESPTYYVLPQGQTASGVDQDDVEGDFYITQAIRIVVMVDVSDHDARAEKAIYDARDEREKLFKALLGFTIGDGFYPVAFSAGQLLGRTAKNVFYAYDFTVREVISPECEGYSSEVQFEIPKIQFKGIVT